jgi:DNA-binding MarR family transcriptional regulator
LIGNLKNFIFQQEHIRIEIGYIRKEENKEDVRSYKLYMTDKGRAIIPEIYKIIEEWSEILVQDSSEEEINTSIECLEKILINGEKFKRR